MSLAGQSGYKETEVGWIPGDWRCERLGGHISMLTGAPFKSELFSSSEGVPLIRIRDLLRGYSETGYVGEYDERYIVNTGDVLVGMDGEFHVVRWKGSRALLNQRVLKISHRPGLSDLGFLFFLVAAAIGKIQDGISATTVKHLSTKDLQNLTAALPPLPEQQKIAAILTAVDDKLDVIARQIEATQTLKQGLMQTLFSRGVGTQDADGRWVPHAEFKDSELGEIPAGWTVAPLGELIEKLMDFRGRTPKKLGMDWGGGVIPALSANNVRMGYIDFDRECYLGSDDLYAAWMVQGDTRKNDLVFTMEAPLGNVAVIPDDRKYILSQRVVLLRANQRVKHCYLFQYLRSDTFGKILAANSTGTTAKGIQQKRLVQLPVVVPPPEEQGRIADMLSAIDSKLDALQSKQSHHQKLKRGLMQKLLTGEWRVSLDASVTRA